MSVVERKYKRPKKLSREANHFLIEFIQNHSILWDINRKDFKNMFKKEQIWKELSRLMGGISVDQLKKRWRNIRDYAKKKNKTNSKENPNLLTYEDLNKIKNGTDDGGDNKSIVVYEVSFVDECPSQGSSIENVSQQGDEMIEDAIITNENITMDSEEDTVTNEHLNLDTEDTNTNEIIKIDSEDTVLIENIIVDSSNTQSLLPPVQKSKKRKIQSNDDQYIEAFEEKAKILKELANSLSTLNDVFKKQSSVENANQQYFELFSKQISLLPSELKSKCDREFQRALITIMHKYQDLAEEISE